MKTSAPYNAHFELAPTGHVAIARSCGDGWWEDWVFACDSEWRQLAQIVLEGRTCVRAEKKGAGAGHSHPKHIGRLGTFLLLGSLLSCFSCATASAVRNFGPSSAPVVLTPVADNPTRVPYVMVNDQAVGRDLPSRWIENEFWTRHGELHLPDDFVSTCTRVALFSGQPRYDETGESAFCMSLRAGLPLIPEPSAGDSVCTLDPTQASECAVIFYRSSSPTAEVPVAAYRPDGSRLHVVSTDEKWFDLAVSPAVDTLIITTIALEIVAAGAGS